MSLFWILALVVAVAVVFWLFRSAGSSRAGGKGASAASLRRRIVKMTHDPAVAERLIERERERHPELGERALLRKVIRRLQRDQRR